jgi:peptide methionine sulfoxide reductase MsrB
MFNEGTERPFSSNLLNEKRKGFYHCANCGNKLFRLQLQNSIAVQAGPLFQKLCQELLKQKLTKVSEWKE